jgi:hypothetical protein
LQGGEETFGVPPPVPWVTPVYEKLDTALDHDLHPNPLTPVRGAMIAGRNPASWRFNQAGIVLLSGGDGPRSTRASSIEVKLSSISRGERLIARGERMRASILAMIAIAFARIEITGAGIEIGCRAIENERAMIAIIARALACGDVLITSKRRLIVMKGRAISIPRTRRRMRDAPISIMRAPISIERSLLEIEGHFTSMKWVPHEIIATALAFIRRLIAIIGAPSA